MVRHMLNRRDWASWMQGPRAALESQGISMAYPGERLGLPKSGPGSASRLGRRSLAILIDWAAALLIAAAIFDGDPLSVLAIFYLHTTLFLMLINRTVGGVFVKQRLIGVGGSRALLWRLPIRQLLVCLVLPAVVYDRDQRGLHDQFAKTVVVVI